MAIVPKVRDGLSPYAGSILQPGTDHEEVRLVLDEDSGLEAIIAVHSTVRGPAFGGCRYWAYPSRDAALTDALRLSEGMTLKNALADLPFGGGKAVMLRKPTQGDCGKLFRTFGRAVKSFDGKYITAEDVGTTVADMAQVRQSTKHVSGLSRDGQFGGNPSPMTAFGVFVGIRAAVSRLLKRAHLNGAIIAVQGLGSVGWELCQRLRAAGAELIVADIDDGRVQAAVTHFGATAVSPKEILSAKVDVLAPCALGAVLNRSSVERVRAQIVVGAANNQLAALADGDLLHKRGVFYVPDFLVNAGGIISVAREMLGETSEQAVLDEVAQIEGRAHELIDRVKATGRPPARVADEWARSKVHR